jgi:hypothetical protein
VEEIARGMIFGKGLAELLRCPCGCGLRSDGEVHNAPPIVVRMTRTNKSRYVMVGTTKKSAAMIWVT